MADYDVERFLRVGGVHGPTFGPDGDRLAFLGELSGTRQAWCLDGPRRWPTRLTFGDDRLTFVSWCPTADRLAFGRDAGGDQRTQLYLVDERRRVRELTDDPSTSHRWGGWSNDGERFAYAADARTSGAFDVFVQSPADGTTECVLETDGWYDVLGWAPDDEHLLLRETNSSLDHELYVTDLAGEVRPLTDGVPSARYLSANWGPDGERVWVVTDVDADTRYVGRIDRRTGDLERVRLPDERAGAEWNVEGLNLHAPTGTVVYGRNVDGYTEVTVAERAPDGGLERVASPDLPEGVAGQVTFAPDGEAFALTVTTPTRPPDVYVVDADGGAVERWTDASTAGIPQEAFRAPDVVRYESVDGLSVPALFARPASDEPVPAVVDVHGGPEDQRRPEFRPVRQHLLASGYAVLEPNVRGSTGYGAEYAHLDDRRNRVDAVEDVAAARHWLAERPGIDADRVAVLGESYGGLLALLTLAHHPDCWAAGVGICPIADLVAFLESTSEWRRPLREEEYGSLAEDREFLERISPTTVADEIRAPVLLVHGENDPRVPVEETRRIAAALREQDVPVETLILPDEGHGLTKLPNRVQAFETVASFLEEHA